MKIFVLARTRNESRNIQNFIKQYSFADKIFIEDYSDDETMKLARRYSRMYKTPLSIWRCPDDDVFYSDGAIFTNQPKQINRIVNKAKEGNPNWLIWDDVDSWPNYDLKKHARRILMNSLHEGFDKVKVYHLYIYKGSHYFPDMNKPGQGMWAWRPAKVNLWCDEQKIDTQHWEQEQDEDSLRTRYLDHPFILLHHFASTEDEIQRKLKHYTRIGKKVKHPKESCGKLEPLPAWADI